MPEVDQPLALSASGLSGGRVAATNVFRRTASGWRLWVHHSSPVIPTGDAVDAEGPGDAS
jgi:hypothetical protein